MAAASRRPRRKRAPWRDRQGRFSWFKTAVLAGCVAPGVLVAFWLATNDIGSRPIKGALLWIGLWTVRFVMIALAITPAAQAFGWPKLLQVRRMVGVTACAYALAHITLYAVDQNLRLGTVAGEIVHRFYLAIGFVALLGLVALAVTSTDAAVRRMGRGWKRLHRLAYPIGVLALLHYFIQSKANVGEAVFLAGLFVWLMAWRALPPGWRDRLAAPAALAVLAAAASAGLEFAWYAIATGIDPWRVLAANETLRFGLRPAHWVGVVTLGIALAIGGTRLLRRRGGMRGFGGALPASAARE
ncbi:MAG: sulfoxide reductase heme-binding subunit YedZ [Rhodospirillales bacterium]|jgi:sulfoxide reductase heme-binding subunit YedZ|nr:sulfoxide reductase heme-binding subunit YedZ [Rhodospirillales bacterium]